TGENPGYRPAIDAVLTMCADPDAMRWGRNARTPWTTPQELTPITHSHDPTPPNQGSPPPATPALLQSTLTCPNCSIASAASASTCSRLLTSVSTATASTPA